MSGRASLRARWRRSLLTLGAGAAAYAAVVVSAQGLVIGDPTPAPVPAADDGADRVVRLLERNDCWTGEAPEGVIPGHAVVTLPHRRAEVVPAEIGFGIWLDGEPGRLHGFCP